MIYNFQTILKIIPYSHKICGSCIKEQAQKLKFSRKKVLYNQILSVLSNYLTSQQLLPL